MLMVAASLLLLKAVVPTPVALKAALRRTKTLRQTRISVAAKNVFN
jgi:hypothetical protein